jgi:nucleoside-diphosphate-sugar epimerase
MSIFLVTGGAGFIGSHIVERLVGEGHVVRVLDNFATGKRENLSAVADRITLIEADIRDPAAVKEAVRGVEIVLHQAALGSVPRSLDDPAATHAANATGALNVHIAAREARVRRVVYASSSSVYGPSTEFPQREDHPARPLSPYAAAKLAGENYSVAFAKSLGLETVALRYFNVFGPRQDPTSAYAAVIPRFITALKAGRPLTIHGDGEQSRDFTYVDNVVEANVLAANARGVSGEVFNIACGGNVSVNTIATRLCEIMGRPFKVEHTGVRLGDLRRSYADVSKAGRMLGYRPIVDFEEGLRRSVRFFTR